MSSMYLQQLVNLVQKLGSLPEQQLIGRWQKELEAIFQAADRQLLNKALGLEFGIEDALALKINLKARSLGAVTALLSLIQQSPNLVPWAECILDQQLRFHCGVKLTPSGLSRELYLYPKDHARLRYLLGHTPFQAAVEELKPLFLGIDDQRGYSMYFPATDTAWVDALRVELGLPDWQGAKLWPWQQLRFDGQRLIPGKTAIELSPLPASVLARFASHYPFPYFRYLIPLRDHANGNFGRDPVTGRFALYAGVS